VANDEAQHVRRDDRLWGKIRSRMRME
jgi:hypothetical protein